MKYPKILNCFFKTKIQLTVYSDETDISSRPITIISNQTYNCNYQSASSKNSSNLERSKNIKAVIMIKDNIFKNVEQNWNGGYIIFDNEKSEIETITLVRNPDGTVNYTRITTK